MPGKHSLAVSVTGLLLSAVALAQPAQNNKEVTTNPHLKEAVIPPLLIIAPTEVRTDPTLAKGCWVRLFAQPDFKGNDDITIAGPIEIPSLHTPEGVDWTRRTGSILVGPKATVTVFETENYHDRTASFKPGTQVMRLRTELKFTQSINSLKIACSK